MTTAIATEIDLSQDACDARLQEELLFITQHPQTWDQCSWGYTDGGPSDWTCRTVACLAGHAASRAGLAEPMFEEGTYLRSISDLVISPVGIELGLTMFPVRGRPSLMFAEVGAVLFGISSLDVAWWMFDMGNTLTQMWMIAGTITEGRVTLPNHLAKRVADIDRDRASASCG